MTTNIIDHAQPTHRHSHRLRTAALAASSVLAATSLAATLTACGPIGAHSYEAFASAVDHGASCRELFDIRTNFHRQVDLTKIDADLARIGCTSPTAVRRH